MTVRRGRFIVVEGLEGAGKSTAIQTIKQYLSEYTPEVIITREPGGTRVGEVIRTLIKDNIAEESLDYRAELLLLYAARIQLVERIIRPALDRGCWVIADRFELSTFAYQGGGRHLDKKILADLSQFCLQDFKPDLILFLDLNPEQGLQRVQIRGKKDRIEQESLVFFKEVYDSYHQLIRTMDNVVCIDASESLQTVQRSLLMALKAFLSNHLLT
ncbi:dTMP kinase [Legionella fairfieldensis]|uniref:dTMP kinase n=1 Tax=Legionella fairfieldensis TaxID=45064 RepID=UPI0004910F87|nr:dTMP kinase [Legionella fairfieldensis]